MRTGNLLIYSAADNFCIPGRGRCRAAGGLADREGASLADEVIK